MKRFILFIIMFLAVCAVGTNYYVDPAMPDDSGDGLSPATAEKTIAAAIADCSTGDTVKLLRGTYNTTTQGANWYLSFAVNSKNVVIESNDATVTLSPSNTTYGILLNCNSSVITVNNVSIVFPTCYYSLWRPANKSAAIIFNNDTLEGHSSTYGMFLISASDASAGDFIFNNCTVSNTGSFWNLTDTAKTYGPNSINVTGGAWSSAGTYAQFIESQQVVNSIYIDRLSCTTTRRFIDTTSSTKTIGKVTLIDSNLTAGSAYNIIYVDTAATISTIDVNGGIYSTARLLYDNGTVTTATIQNVDDFNSASAMMVHILAGKTLTDMVLKNNRVSHGTLLTTSSNYIGDSALVCDNNVSVTTASASISFGYEYGSVTAWETNTSYTVGLIRKNTGEVYECTVAHTSGDANEPGVGGSWANVWKLFDLGIDIVIRDNRIVYPSPMDGHSIFIGYGANNSVISGNYIQGGHYQIVVKSHNNVISNNITNGSWGISLYSADNNKIYHNTCYSTGGICLHIGEQVAGYGSINNDVNDNIFISAGTSNYAVYIDNTTQGSQNRFNYNCYYGGTSSVLYLGGTVCNTIAAAKTRWLAWSSSYPNNDSASIIADPCFVSPPDNLRLKAGSPCIDAGDNNSVPPDYADLDSDGNTTEPTPYDLDSRGRITDGNDDGYCVVDMGAYEFLSYTSAYIGDFDCQCDVDFQDFATFALAWLTEEGQTNYKPICDISLPADRKIDMLDLEVFVQNWLAGTGP